MSQPFDPYTATIRDPANLRMREASGRVNDTRPLVAFLYNLARDEVPMGTLEGIITRSIGEPDDEARPFMFTNGWLARWAQDVADRLIE